MNLKTFASKGNRCGRKVLAEVVKKLKHRPRKCLGYLTPHNVFMEASRGAVAM